MLRIEQLCGGYEREQYIFENVSFEVEAGTLAGIIGNNGSGKSTLVKALANLLPFRSGGIYVNMSNLSGFQTHQLKKQGVAFFMQKSKLFESLSAEEHFSLLDSEIDNELLAKAGIDHRKKTSFLSGGQKNSLALALSLKSKPSVLILDEPFAGLSSEKKYYFINHLKKVVQENRIAVLWIEHDEILMKQFADRIYYLYNKTIHNEI